MAGGGKKVAADTLLAQKAEDEKKKPIPERPDSVTARTRTRKKAAQDRGRGRLSTILSEKLG